MKTLDCENLMSTICSLEEIFNTESSQILSFLRSFELDKIYANNDIQEFPHEHLYKCFLEHFKTDFNSIQAYWFHATRMPINTSFDNGILPLKEMIKPIETNIDTIAKGLGLQKNEAAISSCEIINHKLSTVSDPGPWGFLVKEFAINPPNGIHNYLKTPELVQDIISCKYRNSWAVLEEEYRKLTKPCLIKFLGSELFHPEKLSYVIHYVYNRVKNHRLTTFCSTNTSNRGQLIPFDSIEKIEFII